MQVEDTRMEIAQARLEVSNLEIFYLHCGFVQFPMVAI
jgi:hypothetical protein